VTDSSPTPAGSPGTYGDTFHSRNAGELDRLRTLADVFDPFTQNRLRGLPDMPPDPRILEVGPGAKSVAAFLKFYFRPAELVLLDNDPELVDLGPTPASHVRGVLADLRDPDVAAPGAFDLIHARLVLMHLPSPQQIVERLVSWLNPGGWLVVSDGVHTGSLCADATVATAMDALMLAARRAMGSDFDWGRTFPEPLRRCGLQQVGLAVDVPTVTGGSKLLENLALSLNPLRSAVQATGALSESALADAMAHMSDPTLSTLSPFGLVTMWGQRPR
jgi:SAM-dependent methyltransferase